LKMIENLLGMGINRVILGTVAINDQEMVASACNKYGEAVVVGIDARDGKVAIEGWGVTAEKDAPGCGNEGHWCPEDNIH